jgi:hypothetical protein
MSLGGTVIEMAATLRDCLSTELALRANPPADTCLIPGEDGRTFLSVGLGEDRCCAGFAWVRVARVAPVIPPAGEDPGNCGIDTWQVDFEMGVARCAPTGENFALAGPTCAEWTESFAQVQRDAEAMRAALCCFRPQVASGRTYPTEWLPFGPLGGCTGGIMGVSIKIDDCDCDD